MHQVATYLQSYLQQNPQAEESLKALSNDLAIGDELFNRNRMEGHVTCSALVLSPDLESVLLIHHKLFERWMPPGGHNEEAEPLVECALREVKEETGLENLDFVHSGGMPLVLDIDTHPIPARPSKGEGEHQHHDFMFLAIAKGSTELRHQESEVNGAQWAPRTMQGLNNPRLTRVLAKACVALNLTR